LQGDLAYESSMPRLAGDEERFVLAGHAPDTGGARSPQPGRAKDHSPAIRRWGLRRRGTPVGVKEAECDCALKEREWRFLHRQAGPTLTRARSRSVARSIRNSASSRPI
jgi:hypothetical protein